MALGDITEQLAALGVVLELRLALSAKSKLIVSGQVAELLGTLALASKRERVFG